MKKQLSPEKIIENIVYSLNVSKEQIISKNRKREISEARHLCFYFLRNYTSLSLKSIGKMIGMRDHATIIHGVNNIENVSPTNEILLKKIKICSENMSIFEDVNVVKMCIEQRANYWCVPGLKII